MTLYHIHAALLNGVDRWYILIHFGRSCNGFFGTFHGHLVYLIAMVFLYCIFVVIWYTLQIWLCCSKKSGITF
jgi:hypothetical protein